MSAISRCVRRRTARWFCVQKLPTFFDHPLWVEAWSRSISDALDGFDAQHALFTAHSIPASMAQGCGYQAQLQETIRLAVAGVTAVVPQHELVFQSRSGPPSVPWLGPDVVDRMRELAASGVARVLVVPIGFLSDHMEVVWDLDEELVSEASKLGVAIRRHTIRSPVSSF